MDLIKFTQIQSYRNPRIFHRLKYPHLRLADQAPMFVIRVCRIAVHRKLHHQKRQIHIVPVLPPFRNQLAQQALIHFGLVVITLPLIVNEPPQRVWHHALQHTFIEPRRAERINAAHRSRPLVHPAPLLYLIPGHSRIFGITECRALIPLRIILLIGAVFCNLLLLTLSGNCSFIILHITA